MPFARPPAGRESAEARQGGAAMAAGHVPVGARPFPVQRFTVLPDAVHGQVHHFPGRVPGQKARIVEADQEFMAAMHDMGVFFPVRFEHDAHTELILLIDYFHG